MLSAIQASLMEASEAVSDRKLDKATLRWNKIQAFLQTHDYIKGVSQLRILSPLGLLYLVPEGLPVAKPLRRMGWQKDLTMQNAVLCRVVIVLPVVVTV